MRTPITCASAAVVLLALLAGALPAQVDNPSFEYGLSNWQAEDLPMPLFTLSSVPIGTIGYFGTPSQPSDGDFSLVHGFDGDGPGTISIAQDLLVPKQAPVLRLEWFAQWDLASFAPPTGALDRSFQVQVQDPGSLEPLAAFELLRARAYTLDTGGPRWTAAVPLHEFAGQDVRLRLAWWVPQDFTGPAWFELDHLRLVGPKVAAERATSLRVGLDLAQTAHHDSFKLVFPLWVGEGYDPDGAALEVRLGDLLQEFVLDHQGRGQNSHGSARLAPLAQAPGWARLTVKCTQGNWQQELDACGLCDVTTPKLGTVTGVPVSISLGGNLATRDVFVVWKAKQGAKGKAVGKAPCELLPAHMTLRLDLGQLGQDRLQLRTVARTGPGFDPGNQSIELRLGTWRETFPLDWTGQHVVSKDWSVKLHRDPADPLRYVVEARLFGADFAGVLADLLEADQDTPKGGLRVAVPVEALLDGRGTQVLLPVTYKAKQGQSGTAKG